MGRVRGAINGGMSTLSLVTLTGGVLGFIEGWAPCHGVPFSTTAAAFGAVGFLVLLGIPAAVIGAGVGAVYASEGRRWTIGRVMVVFAALASALAVGRAVIS